MGEAKRRKAVMGASTPVNLQDFAQYILPAAPLDFVERVAAIGLGKGLNSIGKDIAANEIRSREHEQREYIGPEPMDKHLTATMELKFNKTISSKDSVRWHEGDQALVFAVYNRQAEIVGVLKVKPSILRQHGGPQ